MFKFFTELKRRNVFRVAGLYAVVGWLLLQIAAVLENSLNLPPWFDTFVTVFVLLGFPVAMLLAWAFEMTPEGVKPTQSDEEEESLSARLWRRLDYGILTALVLVAGMIGWQISRPHPGADMTIAEKSIAVLPFADLSPDHDQEFFSDGLSEELLNLLAKIPDLRVAARTSAFAFKNKDVQILDIAEALKVGHVLEGSVRMSGKDIRITAQLIDGKNGYHLWSETYDRTLDDIFEVQDDIAAQVVHTLKINLLGEVPRTHKTSADAYGLFLRGRHMQLQYTPESLKKAIEFHKQTVEIDPEYVPAWTNLSSVYINQMSSGQIKPDDGCPLARNAAKTALALDPEYANGYSKLAALASNCDQDKQAAAHYFEKALALAPRDPSILGDAAVLAESLGRLELAVAIKEHQAKQQPVEAIAHNNLALAYYFSGRYDEAEKSIRTALVLSPDYIGAQYRLGAILLMRGHTQDAFEAFTKEADDEYRTKGIALAQFALGDEKASEYALQDLITGWGHIWPDEIAQVYAFRNEPDQAFEWLEKRFEKGGLGGWTEGKLDPLVASLKDDPRWEPFLQKMQISDAQLDKIEFNLVPPK